jgi:cyclopropane fatty-acyl-phospholipid synthase-like methyltransferase
MYIGKAAERGYKNINVYTGDINSFDLPEAEFYGKADRVISIEMFEHMKNYELLLEKVSNWLKPEGKLFVHIFTHKDVPGHYEKGWMTDNFFSGGTLPSDSLLLYFPKHMSIEQHWLVNGTHYQKTLEAWCALMDSKKKEVNSIDLKMNVV